MTRDPADILADPAIVVSYPDEDCSPEAFSILLDEELLAGRGPELECIGAADALRELRADALA